MTNQYNRNNQEVRFIERFDREYPARLQDIKNPPAGIYVQGKLPDYTKKTVAMVGSRMCSAYGRSCAAEFAKIFVKHDVQIISGMARGIDGISQGTAAREGGATFGVLGCGIHVVYPKENETLYYEVLRNGGLISEFHPEAPPLARQFPVRNRIISGLSDLVLVIEAEERSGTGITVQRALEQGKDVFAVPGRVHDLYSQGCNRLISQGAGIAYSPEIVLDALGIVRDEQKQNDIKKIFLLEKREKVVYSNLDFYAKDLETISLSVKLPIGEVLEALFCLQMKGLASEIGKNNYVKLQDI